MISKNNDKIKKNIKEERASKVLFVCVYDTIVFQITNSIIYAKFQKFGAILRLLIFQKCQVTKFFIEYQNINNAIEAKDSLDGTKLCQNICKMTIYFSNLNNVDLKHQTTQGMDYFSIQNTKKNFLKQFDLLSNKGSQGQVNSDDFHQEILMKSFSSIGSFSHSKTDDPKLLQKHLERMNILEQSVQEQIELQSIIVKQIDYLLDSQSQVKNNKTIVPKIKQQGSPIKNSILKFKLKFQVQINLLYNLFSNFGNISWISIKKTYTYVKFRSVQFAAICFTYLNNTSLFGNIIIFEYAHEKQNNILFQEGQYASTVFYDFLSDRFTPNRSITINPPSQVLHVSSMKRQICKESTLLKIFGEYGQIDRIKILEQSRQKNMALIKFFYIQDSFDALSSLHNQVISGRKIQISFTKSKL